MPWHIQAIKYKNNKKAESEASRLMSQVDKGRVKKKNTEYKIALVGAELS